MAQRFLSGIADFSYCLNKWRYRSMRDSEIFSELEAMDAKAFQLDFLFDHEGGAENREIIKRRAEAAGITLTGAEYGPPTRKLFERQVAAAKELGMTVVRHAFQPNILLKERLPLPDLESALRTAAEVYAGTGLRYALENHQDYTAEELVAAFEKVDSPDIGVFLDTGNSIALLEDPLHTARLLAPHTFGIHLKEYAVLPAEGGFQMLGVPLGEGVIENAAVLEIIAREAPEGTIPVLLENPIECCRADLLSEPYRRILGECRLADLGAVAALIEASQAKFPEGITLVFQDASISPEQAQEHERQHNRKAYAAQIKLLAPHCCAKKLIEPGIHADERNSTYPDTGGDA